MTRVLLPVTQADVVALVTRPGLLVEILFSTPLRLSSRGEEFWRGQRWAPWHIKTSGLGVDGSASTQSGTLTLGNSDLGVGVLILEEGVADRPVNIWSFYGTEPTDDQPVQIFGGVGDNASIDPNNGSCQIGLKPAAGVTLYSPRMFMSKEQGWNHLPASGSAITWGRMTITLKAEGI